MWEKVLSDAYPVIQLLVGEDFFGGLSRAFGIAVPSSSPDLNEFGAGFADFLADFTHVAGYPYFPDMARLEWALHRAHYAESAPQVLAGSVMELAPESIATTRFQLHPACVMFASDYSVVPIWRAHQADLGVSLPARVDVASHAVIARPYWRPSVLPLEPASYAALAHLADGGDLGSALQAARQIDQEFDPDAELRSWLDAGMFCKVNV